MCIRDSFGVDGEYVPISVCGAVLKEYVNSEADEQQKEERHHNAVGPLDPAAYSHDEDKKGHGDGCQLP